jgi:prophage antirepressor-like protein
MTTSTNPTQFEFNGAPLRIFPSADGTSFSAAANDVCAILGLNNPRQALSRLDDDERGVITSDTLGGPQSINTVTESGLYALVLTSRKEEAKAFRKWITAEVMPSIRRTGAYIEPTKLDAIKRETGAMLEEIKRSRVTIERLQREIQAAQLLALASDPRLARVARYRRKDLNGAEIALLTGLSETTTRRLIKKLEAAGICTGLTEEGEWMVGLVRNGLVSLDPAPDADDTDGTPTAH